MVNIDLASFSFDTSEIVQGAAEVKRGIDELKQEQKELVKEGKGASEQYVQNAADLKTLNGVYNQHVKYLADASKETLDQTVRTEALTQVLEQEATTIKGLRDQNKILNQLRNSANLTTAEGRAELEQLNAKLDENNERIKENVDQYTQQKINVGNYTESMRGAFSIQGLMTGGLTGLTTALKTAATGMMGMVRASLAFIATPIGAVIAAVGLVLGAIVNYLKSTQEGMDLVTSVTRPLSALFQGLIGILQQVGKFLFEAFSRPQETLKSLYDFVKNQIMRQFQAFGKILEGIFTLDFDLIKEGFSDLAEQAKENLDLIAGAGKAMTKRMKEAYDNGVKIDALQKEIEEKETAIIGIRAQASLDLKKQENIMKNQLLTSEERNAAVAEHARITEELIAAEEEILKKQIEQLILKQKQNSTNRIGAESLRELAQLEAQLLGIQEKREQGQKKSQGVIKQLEDERNNAAKKAVDDRIKKEKELIDLYVQQQGIQSRTLSEQLEMERAVSEMKLKVLDQELKAKKLSQEQYAREVLAIQQGLARMEAEIAVEAAQREVEAYRRGFEEQMNERRFLSDSVVAEKTSELDRLMEKEMEFARLRLEQGLINQQEFDDAIFELTEANRLAIAEINAEREAVEKEEALELRALQFEEELERMLEENATRFEIEQEQAREQFEVRKNALDEQLQQGLISEELYNARLEQLTRERANTEEQIERAVAQNKLDVTQSVLSQLASIIGKETAAGKAIAVAQATMDTYKAAVAAYAAGSSVGGPAGVVLGPLSAGLAVAAGIANVKKILSTKIPGGGGGGGSAPTATGMNSAMNLSGQGVNLGSANTNVQNQVEQGANTANANEQMAEAVQAGAQAGTESGSQQGITNLSANRQIMQGSEF